MASKQTQKHSEVVRRFTIVVRGDDEGAYEDALNEALRQVRGGNLAGMNTNDEGGFYFDSTADVSPADRPR